MTIILTIFKVYNLFCMQFCRIRRETQAALEAALAAAGAPRGARPGALALTPEAFLDVYRTDGTDDVTFDTYMEYDWELNDLDRW